MSKMQRTKGAAGERAVMTNLTKYSLMADVAAVSVTARAAANPNGAYYLAADVDAQIDSLTAENDRLRAACELFVKYDSGLFDDVDDIGAYVKANDAIREALKEQPFE